MLLLFFSCKTDRKIKPETLSFIIRRVLYICVGKSVDGHEESWFDRLSPRLLRNPNCGNFYHSYVNLNPSTLDYVMVEGASTIAKAMAMDEEFLRDFIDRLKQLESPELIMKACEDEMKMVDLEILADATYVSTFDFLLNSIFSALF